MEYIHLLWDFPVILMLVDCVVPHKWNSVKSYSSIIMKSIRERKNALISVALRDHPFKILPFPYKLY